MSSSKKIISIVTGVVILSTIPWLGCKPGGDKNKSADPAGNAKGNSKTPLIDGYVVKAASLDEIIEASGTLQSNEEVEIKPEINGRIIALYFKEGTPVTKGTLLVKLYDEDLRAQLQKLQLQQQLAKTTLERQENLLKINGISRQDVDVTRNQVSAYGADIAYTLTQLQRTELRAPFNGRLSLRNVSVGAIVAPTTVITTLQQIDPLKIDFAIPEKYRTTVKVGDAVQFKVAGDTSTYKGSIYVVDPKIDLTTRTIRLRAIMPNTGNLFPGSFARVNIRLRDQPNAIVIPSQAVIPGTRDKKVIVADSGKAKFIIVQTGIRNENNVQITDGLKPGDTIATSGILQLKAGMPLKFNKVQ
ncbi:efflux RND transporter periplasmic adaptor subunit [Chitinophaga pendula]|uniref:efflux RND transporter periplasmic adaptor subunit n=1 Tax=Chitinophaga TaxID=79328 RepID=UPI000BB0C21F|nr:MULTISPECIES: efflux RND transporter periplasmic adaptor subunit [Chitinophaga]ASZ09963.1 efflux transporter periplasmic adaptor subunit [Chitinophaga sp. MD30]UCJ07095.1 efflux RND transporter periplasmic adaptor subunit [Chitinophaga pendula]